MKRKIVLAMAMAMLCMDNAAHADIHVVRYLQGYQCTDLITDDPSQIPNKPVPVYAGPNAGDAQIGDASGITIVAKPLKVVNGRVKMVRINGQTGWISAAELKPYKRNPPSDKCFPAKLSNGRYGFTNDPPQKG